MGICSENKKTYRYSSIAQSVERMTVNHDVAGSSPAGGAIVQRTKKCLILYAPLAQPSSKCIPKEYCAARIAESDKGIGGTSHCLYAPSRKL